VPPEACPDFTGLSLALRLSMPVFVAPATPAKPDLAWSATYDTTGAIVVRADNSGGAHARVFGLTLTPGMLLPFLAPGGWGPGVGFRVVRDSLPFVDLWYHTE